ncbi:hypothetical protein IH992_18355 [Candidatus Poribacteria bacterium]|nr:hypothetical protein [Candidatus Poribacteria bacterium]
MNNGMDFDEAMSGYPPPEDEAEVQAEEQQSTQPSLDELQGVFGVIFNEGQAKYVKKIAGIPYEINMVTILQSEDGKLLPAIEKDVIPQQFSVTGHGYPKLIVEGVELILPSCARDYHKEIIFREGKTIQVLHPMMPVEEAVQCHYGDYVCPIHAFEFKTSKKIVCVDHLAEYCEYLEKSVRYSSTRRLSQKLLELIGLRKPRTYKKSEKQYRRWRSQLRTALT